MGNHERHRHDHAPRRTFVLVAAPLVAAGAAAAAIVVSASTRRLGATRGEARRTLPGDELLDRVDQADRAVTIAAAPDRVRPWIAQLGQDKGRAQRGIRGGSLGGSALAAVIAET